MLIDNSDIQLCLLQKNVIKYLNEEGAESFVIRGFGLGSEFSVLDYYESLPADYIFSSVPGSPIKKALNRQQESELVARLKQVELAVRGFSPIIEPVALSPDALQQEIKERLNDPELQRRYFSTDEQLEKFQADSEGLSSRSQWYAVSEANSLVSVDASVFRAELIDPAYNSLFVGKGEAFIQDDIRILSNLPTAVLDGTVLLKAFRNERAVLDYGLTAIEWISSLGTTELARFLTDKMLDYCEQKAQESGEKFLSRKNWFGMYDVMRTKLGLEIK